MRKILFFAIATAMLGMTFTSCDKDDKDESSEKTGFFSFYLIFMLM